MLMLHMHGPCRFETWQGFARGGVANRSCRHAGQAAAAKAVSTWVAYSADSLTEAL